MTWFPIREYFEKVANQDAKRRCRNLAQKKAFLVKELGLTVQLEAWMASLEKLDLSILSSF